MRIKLGDLIKRMQASAGPTLRRFWVSVGFTIALTATLIINTTGRYQRSTETLNRLSLALLAGILTSWCAILFWESWNQRLTKQGLNKKKPSGRELTEQQPGGKKHSRQGSNSSGYGEQAPSNPGSALIGNLIALVFASLVTWATYALLKSLSFVAVSRHVGICICLFLLFFIIPHTRKTKGLEMYIVRLFSQAVIAVLFAAVLFIGLAAITLTVTSLFSLDISYRIYIQIWLVMVGVVAPFLFMAGIPMADATVKIHDYPTILNNLIMYVVTPILAAYTFILYLYFAKILITRQWPVGLVSHLVLWYSVATTAILYFVWPLASTNRWAEAFAGYFPKLVLPLLAMMFASIGIRINSFGITENRYYVLVLGLWLLGTMLYLNLSKKRKSIVLPVSLAIVVALSVTGPWSSFAVSKWSQNQRLEGLCAQYNMIKGNSIIPSSQVTQSDRREIAAILQYFDRYHDLSDVKLLPSGFTLAQFEEVFGFGYADTEFPRPVQSLHYEAADWSMDVSKYEYLFDYTKTWYEKGEPASLSQNNVLTTYDWENQCIAVSLDGNLEWGKSFADLIGSIQSKYETQDSVEFLPEDMVFEEETANLRIKVVINSMWGQIDYETQEPVMHHVGFFLFVQVKE